MDVQPTANTATLPPVFSAGTGGPQGVADGSLRSPGDAAAAPAAPQTVALLPPTGGRKPDSPATPLPPTHSLANDVAKLFTPGDSNLSVSFRAASGSDQIVVVVTDKSTGQTVSQFPSETLIALAQFFNKLDGSVVDKKV